jgi:hypothetical protein
MKEIEKTLILFAAFSNGYQLALETVQPVCASNGYHFMWMNGPSVN